MSIKIIIGIAIIAASFVYILKRPDKSLMDSLMEKRNSQMQEALAHAEEAGEKPDGSASEPASGTASESDSETDSEAVSEAVSEAASPAETESPKAAGAETDSEA